MNVDTYDEKRYEPFEMVMDKRGYTNTKLIDTHTHTRARKNCK